MKYLFIGAHPDDVEFSCGGTMLRLADEGHEVYMVLMTGGDASPNCSERERRSEQLKAAKYAKIKDIIMLEYRDGHITADSESVRQISDILSTVNPDFAITHYPNDSHQDHRATAAIVKSATRRKCSLLYFDSYSSIGFAPNLYVDVSKYICGKVDLLKCHGSQIAKYRDRNIDFIRKSITINELNGYECKLPFAEGFVIDTYVI